jgi:hypothetical protein
MTMNANATQHPLAKLASAESALIASIESAAAKLDAVGTSALDAALSRLRDAAHAAAARLGSAGDAVAHVVNDVLEGMLAQAGRIEAAMSGGGASIGIPMDAAPTFQGYAHQEQVEAATVATDEISSVATPVPAPSSSPDGIEDIATPEPAHEPRRTGLALVDDFLDVARDAEAPAFSPDGPTLFDDAGDHESDPTEVLVGPNAVEYKTQRPGPDADESPVFPVASPRRKKKGR